jgi:hypothetical protein
MRWKARDSAEADDNMIRHLLDEKEQQLILPSGLRKLPKIRQKDAYLGGVWKKGQEHTFRCVHYNIYYCLMRHRCECKTILPVVMAHDFIELQHYPRPK